MPLKGEEREKVTNSIKFQIKDKTKQQHKHNLTYNVKCPECRDDYLSEIGIRLYERGHDHGGKHKKLYILNHSYEKHHANVSIENVHILGNGYSNNTFKKNFWIPSL